ncbi:hypothetical protein MFIFM68171_01754 [Madurella fahalii]|uniref:Uncharacterized protein n=1 Tax=Madurella fahalii TaxID=1157608 RepID=A0ABQ0G1C2_9PEZI
MGNLTLFVEGLGNLTYRDDRPASEQKYVRDLNLKLRVDSCAEVSENELRRFVTVYPRLYQVPTTSQQRLETWRQANWEAVKLWDADGFWNTTDEDDRLGLQPRLPGIPPEAKSASEEEQAADHSRRAPITRSGNRGDDVQSPGSSRNRRHRLEQAPGQNQPPSRNTSDTIPQELKTDKLVFKADLKVSLDLLGDVHSVLEHMSDRLDQEDPWKDIFSRLAKNTVKGMEGVERVASALFQRMSELSTSGQAAPRGLSGAKKRGRQSVDTDGSDADSGERWRRIYQKRGQLVSELNHPRSESTNLQVNTQKYSLSLPASLHYVGSRIPDPRDDNPDSEDFSPPKRTQDHELHTRSLSIIQEAPSDEHSGSHLHHITADNGNTGGNRSGFVDLDSSASSADAEPKPKSKPQPKGNHLISTNRAPRLYPQATRSSSNSNNNNNNNNNDDDDDDDDDDAENYSTGTPIASSKKRASPSSPASPAPAPKRLHKNQHRTAGSSTGKAPSRLSVGARPSRAGEAQRMGFEEEDGGMEGASGWADSAADNDKRGRDGDAGGVAGPSPSGRGRASQPLRAAEAAATVAPAKGLRPGHGSGEEL